ncbi:mannose-P-dolichol utilization defect 1-like protein 2 [Micractinium conductrix]|uniref:Mannose-P-dolichol utilization defect 1-like protein 2 n=1 Tax=Micractinium conductrix TaxID=554055 RepID=A0A2P6V2M7_9CHLO|nr:mannose-P-dolichol utilization defect 1-like protein 2 [Micractinium conductrix]|eukprot:PSC68347.1 mannose-P-dolichol utilization defect 1-like protein 2 [Micractinium conductrix]
MGAASCIFHVVSFLQVAVAVAIAVVTAVKLVDVNVEGIDFSYTCLLGQSYGSSSLCTYTFVVCGVSVGVSALVSITKCCTCNLCGLGRVLDILLAAFGAAWWGVASGIIGSNANKGLPASAPSDGGISAARDAVPIMAYTEVGLFCLMLLTALLSCLPPVPHIVGTMADLFALIRLALKDLGRGTVPPSEILKPLISKGLGYGILAGSTLVKVPQVANVVRAKSAAGLAPLSAELETVGLLIAVTYGFVMGLPFSAFGETVALLLQNNLLLVLIYYYQRRSLARAATVGLLLAGAGAVALSGGLTKSHVTALYDCQNLILVASRLPQIWSNFVSKATGQLSIITYALNAAGAAARIFTSIQEQAGAAMLRGAMISTLLNAILALQIVWYGRGGKKQKKGGSKRSSKSKAA